MNINELAPAVLRATDRAHPISFADLRLANVSRCEEVFHPIESWSPTDWGTAVAGEVGEALNLVKKGRRGEPVSVAEIATEIADAVIYIDLLAARLGIDLGEAVASKFNEVSRRRRSSVFVTPRPSGPGCASNLVYQDDGRPPLPPGAPPDSMVHPHKFVGTYGPNQAPRWDARCNICLRFADDPVHVPTETGGDR